MAKQSRHAAAPARPRQILLERQPDESPAQWEQTLAVIVSGGVATVTRQSGDSALICWPAGGAL